MARPKAKAPARSYHVSGQSIVRIDGRDFYLGKHDSPESLARYAVLISVYQAGGMNLPDDFDARSIDAQAAILLGQSHFVVAQQSNLPVQVQHIMALYREYVKGKYKYSIQDRQRFDRLCDILDEECGDLAAKDFGPLKLSEIRDLLIVKGLRKLGNASDNKVPSRSYVNRLVRYTIAVFSHAVSKELIPVEKIQQLKTLEPLRYGYPPLPVAN